MAGEFSSHDRWREVTYDVGAVTVPVGPAGADELEILESTMASLAATDPADLPDEEKARRLRVLERIDAIEAAVRGPLLEAFDSRDCSVADGQRTTRTWLVHCTRVTRGQAAEHKAVQTLARDHPVLRAALAEGWVLTKSEALQLAKWTRTIPDDYRDEAEEIVVTAARAGAGELRLPACPPTSVSAVLTLAPRCSPWRLRTELAALRLASRRVAAGSACGAQVAA